MRFYHFTSPRNLDKILGAGAILPSDSNISMGANEGPDVVWMLDTETVEYPHGLQNGADGTDWDKTRVRFTVDVPAIRWLDWAPAAVMPGWWREVMVEAGGGKEAAAHWWVFPGLVFQRRWVEITLDGVPLWPTPDSEEAL